MKAIRNFGLGLTLFIAVAIVLTACEPDSASGVRPLDWADVLNAILLVASLFFLQQTAFQMIVPFQLFTIEEKQEILSRARQYYSRSFFAGTVGLGYLLVACYVGETLRFFNAQDKSPQDFVMIGGLLIALGVFAKIKGVITYLALSRDKLAVN